MACWLLAFQTVLMPRPQCLTDRLRFLAGNPVGHHRFVNIGLGEVTQQEGHAPLQARQFPFSGARVDIFDLGLLPTIELRPSGSQLVACSFGCRHGQFLPFLRHLYRKGVFRDRPTHFRETPPRRAFISQKTNPRLVLLHSGQPILRLSARLHTTSVGCTGFFLVFSGYVPRGVLHGRFWPAYPTIGATAAPIAEHVRPGPRSKQPNLFSTSPNLQTPKS